MKTKYFTIPLAAICLTLAWGVFAEKVVAQDWSAQQVRASMSNAADMQALGGPIIFPTNLSPEQNRAINAACQRMADSRNSSSTEAQVAAHRRLVQAETQNVRNIIAWPGGRDPAAAPATPPAAPARPTEPPARPQPPAQPQVPAKSRAEEKLANAREAFPNNPHDNLDRIPGMNITVNQQTIIVQIQQSRRTEMTRVVTRMKTYRRTPDAARTVFRMLKAAALLHNYRIERQLTPAQIATLRRHQDGNVVNITTWESLGLTEDEAWADRTPTFTSSGAATTVAPTDTSLPQWDDGKSAEELETRLSRANFHHFDEFARFLNLTDAQKFTLDAYGAEFDAALEAALEEYRDLSNPSRAQITRIFTDHAERTKEVAEKIGDQMTRAQMARFDALSILLVDALEFPAMNMASFEGMELSSTDKIRIQGILNDFALSEIDKLARPNRVSMSQQQSVQRTLETNIRSALSGRALEDWNRAFTDNRALHQSVQKHKGLTEGVTQGAAGVSPPVASNATSSASPPVTTQAPPPSPYEQATDAVLANDRSRWNTLRNQNRFAADFANAGDQYFRNPNFNNLQRFVQIQERHTGNMINVTPPMR